MVGAHLEHLADQGPVDSLAGPVMSFKGKATLAQKALERIEARNHSAGLNSCNGGLGHAGALRKLALSQAGLAPCMSENPSRIHLTPQ